MTFACIVLRCMHNTQLSCKLSALKDVICKSQDKRYCGIPIYIGTD